MPPATVAGGFFSPSRRGPHFFQRNGGKKTKGGEVLPLWIPSLWFVQTCGAVRFGVWVGLPLSQCNAVQKRAHRLGAPGVGWYPITRAEGFSTQRLPWGGELSAKLTERCCPGNFPSGALTGYRGGLTSLVPLYRSRSVLPGDTSPPLRGPPPLQRGGFGDGSISPLPYPSP